MIRAEWEYLKKHRFMTIVLIAIIFIPSIYAVTFLKSMWDPYGELGNIPVAVVNHDKSTTYQGTKLAVGKELTTNLKNSSAMDFQVMNSEKDAKQKLSDGKVFHGDYNSKEFLEKCHDLVERQAEKDGLTL